ncbi:MAG: hypothetical protein LBF27_28610 [Sphingobacterium sp.]|jgi:hypothetical protein|nr:hypothetical protein [Sphingobacterium sp.]
MEREFRKKCKSFRLKFGLSEDDVDLLLKAQNIKYKGVESKDRIITLEIAEAYPLTVYGIEYCTFKKEETTFPSFEDLPITTKTLLENKSNTGNKVGSHGTKNKASNVIFALKEYKKGHQFTNSDILSQLPHPLNLEKSIDWNKGLLAGLTKNTRTFRIWIDENKESHREAIYEMIEVVTPVLLEKAKKKDIANKKDKKS